MPRVQDPVSIPGFIYFFAPTSICCILPQDTPPAYATTANPTGKHKLVSGGYKCSIGRRCAAAYCYKCATEHFDHNGVPALADYHRKVCKEQVGTVRPALKRPGPTSPPRHVAKKQKMSTSSLSDPPPTPSESPQARGRASSQVYESATSGHEAEPQRRISTLHRTETVEDGGMSMSDKTNTKRESVSDVKGGTAAPHFRGAERVEKGVCDDRHYRFSGDDTDEDDDDYEPDDGAGAEKAANPNVRRKQPRPKAPRTSLPERASPPTDTHGLRSEPGRAKILGLVTYRRSEASPLRRSPPCSPTGEEWHRVPTHQDFFSSVPDGKGSWLFQGDPRLSARDAGRTSSTTADGGMRVRSASGEVSGKELRESQAHNKEYQEGREEADASDQGHTPT